LSTTSRLNKQLDKEEEAEANKEPFFKNPFSKNFGKFEKVMPEDVTDVERKIPDHIEKPDYWQTGHPTINYSNPKSIEIKQPAAVAKMRRACELARKVLDAAAAMVKPGITTEEIDDFVFNYTIQHGAYPSPLNYHGFPKSVCTSINNVACHGIPDTRPLKDGDIMNIDVMVYIEGYHGDCSTTVLVGNVDEEGKKLVEAAKACLDHGVMVCAPGVPFQRIGQVIEDIAEEKGYTVVPAFTGHGIGHQIHSPPDIYHYDFPYPGTMEVGMTFTVEPVITQGIENIVILVDGWTAVTLDGGRTAQFEHTILITDTGSEILTLPSSDL